MVWTQLTSECNRDLGILKLGIQHGKRTARGFQYSDVHCRAALNSHLKAGVARVSRYKRKPNCIARNDHRSIGAHPDRNISAINAT
jgi:hypothetical protein